MIWPITELRNASAVFRLTSSASSSAGWPVLREMWCMRLACATIAWNEFERSPSRPTISDAADTSELASRNSASASLLPNTNPSA